jgi:hypothetical protein
MIEPIEHLPAEVQASAFTDREFPKDRKIPIVDPRHAKDVPPGITAEVGDAIAVVGGIHKATRVEILEEAAADVSIAPSNLRLLRHPTICSTGDRFLFTTKPPLRLLDSAGN